MHDLDQALYRPADCPVWAMESLPAWVLPYVGINGAPPAGRPAGNVFGATVRGLDRYQANGFIVYSPKTVAYLYGGDYTPTTVAYRRGTLPAYEALAATRTAGLDTHTARARALMHAVPELLPHPTMPPIGPWVAPDRNLDDDALLASGSAWCNEQARVFIRLCQVSGIPARMIHLFGQHHTVAEFFADGRWVLADITHRFVAAGTHERLLSAADCHDRGAGQRAYAAAKIRCLRALLAQTDQQLGFRQPVDADAWRAETKALEENELAQRAIGFGVINYPLPPYSTTIR